MTFPLEFLPIHVGFHVSIRYESYTSRINSFTLQSAKYDVTLSFLFVLDQQKSCLVGYGVQGLIICQLSSND